jgi:hypothetical protein
MTSSLGGAPTGGPSRSLTPEEKRRIAELEVENGFRQYDLAIDISPCGWAQGLWLIGKLGRAPQLTWGSTGPIPVDGQ